MCLDLGGGRCNQATRIKGEDRCVDEVVISKNASLGVGSALVRTVSQPPYVSKSVENSCARKSVDFVDGYLTVTSMISICQNVWPHRIHTKASSCEIARSKFCDIASIHWLTDNFNVPKLLVSTTIQKPVNQ
jgi:hypothetical protein